MELSGSNQFCRWWWRERERGDPIFERLPSCSRTFFLFGISHLIRHRPQSFLVIGHIHNAIYPVPLPSTDRKGEGGTYQSWGQGQGTSDDCVKFQARSRELVCLSKCQGLVSRSRTCFCAATKRRRRIRDAREGIADDAELGAGSCRCPFF